VKIVHNTEIIKDPITTTLRNDDYESIDMDTGLEIDWVSSFSTTSSLPLGALEASKIY
jgi:hypothetical protein